MLKVSIKHLLNIVIRILKEYLLLRKQKKIKELFGTIVYEPDYDYKKQRAVNRFLN